MCHNVAREHFLSRHEKGQNIGYCVSAVSANAGALAMALVLIVMCVLGAMAAFEQQEL